MVDCDDCGHCVDLSTPSEDSPEILKEAHALILNKIQQWREMAEKEDAEKE